jgi:hypothetical protein
MQEYEQMEQILGCNLALGRLLKDATTTME